MSMDRNLRYPLAISLLVALAVALWVQWPVIAADSYFQDDFRKIHWMHRYQDPDLFPADPLTGGSVVELTIGSVSFPLDSWRPAYSLIFLIGSQFASPVLINKLLVFPLVLIFALFAYKIGEELNGPKSGVALSVSLVIFYLASPSSINPAAGLPRSFMAPTILAITYYLINKRYWQASLFVLFGGAVYPPAAVLGGVMVALTALKLGHGSRPISIDVRAVFPLIVAVVILAALVAPIRTRLLDITQSTPGLSTIDSDEDLDARSDARFSEESRISLFRTAPLIGQGGLATKPFGMWSLAVLALLSASSIILLSPGRVKSHRILIILILAGLICFCAAWLGYKLTTSFVLYFPSRYTRVSLGLALMIFIVLNLPSSSQELFLELRFRSPAFVVIFPAIFILVTLVGREVFSKQALGRFVGVSDSLQAWLLAIAFALFIGSILVRVTGLRRSEEGPQLPAAMRMVGYLIMTAFGLVLIYQYADASYEQIDANQVELYRFLGSLPKDVMIGGDLCTLNSVPLLAKRQVIQSCEHLSSSMNSGALENLRAYYAETIQQVEDYCLSAEVDFLVIEPSDYQNFRSGDEPVFFEPYNSIISDEIGKQDQFALERVPEKAVVYRDDSYIVVKCHGPW